MMSKTTTRKIKTFEGIVDFKFKKYVPYNDMLEYIILKKIYFKAFQFIKNKQKLDLLNFKKIFILIMEKEIELNKKKLFKTENHYNDIRKKLLKTIEKHFQNILEIDIVDSIFSISKLKINLKDYMKHRYSEINERYKKNIIKINLEELEKVFFKIDFINIQKIKQNKFNLIITLPYIINEKMIEKNCIIGTLIRFSYLFLEKELNLKFNQLIVYFPLEIKRQVFDKFDIYNNFQDLDWFKVLSIIKNKLTIKTNNNNYCEFCENSFICFNDNNKMKRILKVKKTATKQKSLLKVSKKILTSLGEK